MKKQHVLELFGLFWIIICVSVLTASAIVFSVLKFMPECVKYDEFNNFVSFIITVDIVSMFVDLVLIVGILVTYFKKRKSNKVEMDKMIAE